MSLIFYSSVKPDLKRSVLLKGSLIAGIGALVLLLAGALVPPAELSIWGWPVIIISFGLIALGLIPYRRLCRLEERPSKLLVTDENELIYELNDRKRITIPIDLIEKMEYLENGSMYGIGICLKKGSNLKLKIHDPLFSLKKKFSCDLFLPFFSRRVLAELSSIVVES